MNIARGLAVAGALLLLGACSTVTNYFEGGKENQEPPKPLVQFTPSIKIKVLWSRQVGDGADSRYLKLTPAIEGNDIYAADRAGLVTAYDARTGEQGWQTQTQAPIAGGPGVSEHLVLVGTSKGQVIALDRATGKIAWRSPVTSEVLCAPVESEGIVVARTLDGKLFGLDAATGKHLWVYDRTVPVLTLRGNSRPVVVAGGVIAGFDSGRVVAVLLKTGQEIWETQVAVPHGRTELERMVDIDANPVVAGDVVYVATYQGRIAALELRSGRILWRRDMSTSTGIAVDEHNVYVTDSKSHVWALDRSTSASVWRQSQLEARAVTGPAVYQGYVVVGDLQGYVHWLSSDDGSFVGRTQVDGGAIVAAPVVNNGIVYVYSSGGTLTALQAE